MNEETLIKLFTLVRDAYHEAILISDDEYEDRINWSRGESANTKLWEDSDARTSCLVILEELKELK